MRCAGLLLVLLAATGCWKDEPPQAADRFTCPAGLVQARMLKAWFGLHSDERGVSLTEEQWQGFRDRELTPRFPQGSTITASQGTWRRLDGSIGQEESRILSVVLPTAEAEAGLARLQEAIAAYHALHPQQVVGIGLVPTCVTGFSSP